MPSRSANKADRIFVRDGRRHYRRLFSVAESRIGIMILAALAAILLWVAWKGAHPDPGLFMLETDLAQAGAAAAVERGPLPAQLAIAGWTEGELSQFDYDNVYEKIDGREGYYKSFGFERLYFISIANIDNAQIAVDVELYDLGNSANAVGAYSGERPPDVTPEVNESGLMHLDRNALFLSQGRFYLRALGSEESPEVRAQLEHLRDRFLSELPGEPLPWGYALFVGRMGMDPGALSYAPQNAFSFGFARNVYSAKLAGGDTEIFLTPEADESSAGGMAARFREGFLQYGAPEGDRWVKDRFLGTYAGARSVGRWVVGVLGAPDVQAATKALDELTEVASGFPVPESAPVDAESYETESDDNE